MEKLLHIPHDQIQKKLRISFDTLDDQSKAIFLDIACFFIGLDKDYVMKILDGCGFFPVIGISVLLERSLITIGQIDHKLRMHDLLRDVGREIVREASPNHIGKRSRLWYHQDVGTKAVEGLSLDVSAREDVIVSTEAFAKMVNLRLLKINSVHISTGCYEKFSKELRWLCWHRCPLKVLPPNLDLDNLAVLDMRFSNVKKVWKETKILHRLKILDLSYLVHLVKTPKFSGLSNLERIEFEGCTSLIKVHRSIGLLERLVFLNLANCNNLKELPDSICNLRSLETLNLSGCSKLNRLPKHLGRLEALRKFFADRSAIKQLPVSLGLLKNLEDLSLAGCREELTIKSLFPSFSRLVSPRSAVSSTLLPAMFSHLSSLQCLNLSNQNLSDSDISIDFGSFPFLYHLDLTGNKFYNLPLGISNHSRLLCHCLHDCSNLRSIQKLPPCLGLHTSRISIDRYPNQFDVGSSISFITISNGPKTIETWDLRHHLKETTSSYLEESEEVFAPSTSILKLAALVEMCQIGSTIKKQELHCCFICLQLRLMKVEICYRNKSKGYETFERHDDHPIFDKNVGLDHIWITYQACLIFEEIKADAGDEIEVSTEGSFCSKHKYFEACCPCGDVPNWFDYKETGTSLLFHVPSTSINGSQAMIVCVVYCVNEEHNGRNYDSLTICYINISKGYETLDTHDGQRIFDKNVGQDHKLDSCLSCLFLEEMKAVQGDEIGISTEVEGRIIVKKCCIHLPVDLYFRNLGIGRVTKSGFYTSMG
ncbi:hypothetical protein DITRI_Ditri17bG0031900 [Diplodiscus trichospermus]